MFCTAYAAAKFGIEGWMVSHAWFLSTELLSTDPTIYAQPTIDTGHA